MGAREDEPIDPDLGLGAEGHARVIAQHDAETAVGARSQHVALQQRKTGAGRQGLVAPLYEGRPLGELDEADRGRSAFRCSERQGDQRR